MKKCITNAQYNAWFKCAALARSTFASQQILTLAITPATITNFEVRGILLVSVLDYNYKTKSIVVYGLIWIC